MKSRRRLWLVLVLVLVLLGYWLVACQGGEEADESSPESGNQVEESANADEVVEFEDEAFGQRVAAELGKDEVTVGDLSEITGVLIAADEFVFLSGPGRPEKSIVHFQEDAFEYDGTRYTGYGSMTSLADLANFPRLTGLRIALQPDLDFDTVPHPEQLTKVFIHQSKATDEDIQFLSTATELTNLVISTNNIQDISSLENCTKLVWLSLTYNEIEDISPLKEMTELTYLLLYGNEISDITPLAQMSKLKKLGLYENNVRDIRTLAKLTSLTDLELINNRVTDVSPLKDFKSFDRLALTGNPVENIELLEHIENLEY